VSAAARANGVTSVIEVPEGDLIAAQMSLVRLDGAKGDDMTSTPVTAIHLQFPAIAIQPPPAHEHDDDDDPSALADSTPYAQAKREYDARMRELRAFFEQARRYRDARRSGGAADNQYEPMVAVLDGTAPLFVTAVREREIREAIDFAGEQQIRIILADAYESYKVAPLIASKGIPVVLPPTHSLPLNPDDPYDRSFTTPGELAGAGIRFSIATFSTTRSRTLPYQAATAVAFGLPQEDAYRAVSLSAAEIFGLGNRLGSIDEGKIADLIVTDGDPLEVQTRVDLMFINGKLVSPDSRQRQIGDAYSKQ